MGLGLQQDVHVHAATDHLGGSFHQAEGRKLHFSNAFVCPSLFV